jgi:hypothetical protein
VPDLEIVWVFLAEITEFAEVLTNNQQLTTAFFAADVSDVVTVGF